MDYDFLTGFQPKIQQVVDRGELFWQEFAYELYREETFAHVLALVYEGKGFMQLNDNQYELQRGALFYVPPGSRMQISTQKKQTLRFYSLIFFHGPWHEEDGRMIWAPEMKIACPLPLPEMTYYTENPVLLESFRRMNGIWKRKEIGYVWHTKLELLHMLDMITTTTRAASQHTQLNAKLVESTVVYIRSHLSERLDRSQLASRVSLSPAHFGVLFKQYTGYALTEFVARQRIDRAKELLCSTKLPVHQIAEQVGYSDSFYFTRQFRKETGIPPKEFRKM